jgi:hypothetical protein
MKLLAWNIRHGAAPDARHGLCANGFPAHSSKSRHVAIQTFCLRCRSQGAVKRKDPESHRDYYYCVVCAHEWDALEPVPRTRPRLVIDNTPH